MTFVVKNSAFDLLYLLTPTQIADTITAFPNGIFYLRDITDGVNLGNNTLVQDDYANINVEISNGFQLLFNNRFVPSTGTKQLEIQFYVGYNYGNFAFPVAESQMTYISSVRTAPYQKQNPQWFIKEKTNYFDLTYTLSDQQMAQTLGTHQYGVFFLIDTTDNVNLGNNTIVASDTDNINESPANKVLTFNNRFIPSIGAKQLQIHFYVGYNYGNFSFPVSELLSYTGMVVNMQSTYQFTTRAPAFDLTYTLTPSQMDETIGRFPSGSYILYDYTDEAGLDEVSISQSNKLVFLNRTPPSIGMKEFNIQFFVGPDHGNREFAISENFNYEALPASTICFTGDTPVLTDQGTLPIASIDPELHTIQKKRIRAITKTINEDDYLICLEKDCLYPNVPSQRTVMSKTHKIFYKVSFVPAIAFLGNEGVHKIEYDGQPLYNVLMDKHESILVNHLICETLNPQNKIATLFTEGASLPEYTSYYESKKKEAIEYSKMRNLVLV